MLCLLNNSESLETDIYHNIELGAYYVHLTFYPFLSLAMYFSAGGKVTNEAAASKIVELSKKVRELTAELHSEKTKVKQYGKKCMDLQKQVIMMQ